MWPRHIYLGCCCSSLNVVAEVHLPRAMTADCAALAAIDVGDPLPGGLDRGDRDGEVHEPTQDDFG